MLDAPREAEQTGKEVGRDSKAGLPLRMQLHVGYPIPVGMAEDKTWQLHPTARSGSGAFPSHAATADLLPAVRVTISHLPEHM